MASNDLVKKRTVNLDTATYELLSKFTGSLREANGGFVSMNAAVAVLLDGWKELERIAKSDDVVIITSENIVDRGRVVTPFLSDWFETEKLEL